MKLLHTGDWHLSNRGRRRAVYSAGRDEHNTCDKVQAIGKICEYAEENDIDLIAIPGDLFDNSNPENIAIKVAIEAVERLAEQAPVIIAKGNHDGAKGSEQPRALTPFGSMIRRFGVYISERPDIFSLLIKGQKVNVFTLPYPRRSALKSDPKFKSMSPEELSGFISRKMRRSLSAFRPGSSGTP